MHKYIPLLKQALETPWKIWNNLGSLLAKPIVRLQFAFHGIPWRSGYRFFGRPIIQKHRQSTIRFGKELKLRSSLRSNPLNPNHPVFITTWNANSVLEIGHDFAMTGGVICAFECIKIGDHVMVGANCTIVDTDFHPTDSELRRREPMAAKTAPVVIEDDVFIGMNAIILKGSRIGKGSVIGAGSVVSGEIPAGVIAAGNPARVIRKLGSVE